MKSCEAGHKCQYEIREHELRRKSVSAQQDRQTKYISGVQFRYLFLRAFLCLSLPRLAFFLYKIAASRDRLLLTISTSTLSLLLFSWSSSLTFIRVKEKMAVPKAIVLPLLLVLCGAALGASAYEGKLRTLSVSGFGT